jgi:hypothetical protein
MAVRVVVSQMQRWYSKVDDASTIPGNQDNISFCKAAFVCADRTGVGVFYYLIINVLF